MGGLRVRVLGDFQIEGYETAALGHRRARALLKVLALAAGRPVSVDRLVDCLWPDEPDDTWSAAHRDSRPARPADQVAVLVSRTRTVLGRDAISRSDAGYALRLVWLDLDALADLADETERRLAAGATGAARAAAAAGLALVRGPLLSDEPEARWADPQRARSERLVARMHHVAALAAMAAGDTAGAADLAERALEADAADEVALRSLMTAHAVGGRPGSALGAYARVRRHLAEELGLSPTAETEAIHDAIVMGDLSAAPRSPAAAAAAEDGLPGRHDALAQLDRAYTRASADHAVLVVVQGEAGIGKSRLLAHWSGRAARSGATVLSVRCDELGCILPLQPVLDAVDLLLRGRETDETAGILGPEVGVLGPLLGRMPGGSAAPDVAALTAPGSGEAVLFAALFSVFRRQAATAPVVLLVDDVHLADAATLSWLGLIERRLADAAVLAIVARRAEEGTPLPASTIVSLEPLDVHAVAEVVGERRAADLHARSGGHPLFLVELAGASAESGVSAEAGASESSVSADAELPASIRQAVEERCERTGSAAATLRAAAVLGPDVDLDLLGAVTGTPATELLDHLETGAKRLLLEERGDRFAFSHALVREALAAATSSSRRAFIHREAARALAVRQRTDPLVVARHARLGGDNVAASAALVEAARVAVARFAQDEAVRLLDDAIALDDTPDARVERGRILAMLSRYEEAAADIDAARAMGAGAEALEVAAWAAHFQRRMAEARELADEGARRATDPAVRAACLGVAGWTSLAAGDLETAEDRLTTAVAETSAERVLLPSAWLGLLRFHQGRYAETVTLTRHGPGLAAYWFPNAYGGMAAAMALGMLGRADEALATLDVMDANVATMGARRFTPRALNIRGWVIRNLGATGEADDLNLAARELTTAISLAEPLANAILDLASGRLLIGDADGAERYLREADALTDTPHAFRWRHRLRGRLLRARLDVLTGRFDDAEAGADGLMSDAAALGIPRYEVQAALVRAHARVRAGAVAEDVGPLLDRLEDLAGLESWWIIGELAEVFGVEAWRARARRSVADLITRAGPYAETLERFADARLG